MAKDLNASRRFFNFSFVATGFVSSSSLVGCMAYPQAKRQLLPHSPEIQALESRGKEPRLQTGQAWEFRSINLFNSELGESVTQRVELQENQAGLSLNHLREKSQQREQYAKPWQAIEQIYYGSVLRFEQPMSQVPASLTPGHQEQQQTRYWVLEDGKVQDPYSRLLWNAYTRVLGWERVQVPAGSFDVARIERRIYFLHPDTFRTESTRDEILWYAPSIGYWVARERRGQYLLRGGRRRGGFMREDAERWELTARIGAPRSTS